MKNSLRLCSVIFIVLIVFALNSCRKKEKTLIPGPKGSVVYSETKTLVPGAKHYVVLLVDVEKIKPNSKGRDFCSFPGQNPTNPNDSIENYTTDVLPGDSVIWMGISTSNHYEDTIIIKKIIPRGGPPVLGDTNIINGTVRGIINRKAKSKQKQKYMIHFRVIEEGDTSRNYIIDPKLLVH